MYVGFSKDITAWQEFFKKYADRILFGTDSDNEKKTNAEIHLLVKMALTHDESEFMMPCYREELIRGLHLPSDVLDKICYKNYERFFGEPKAVNTDLVKTCAARLLRDLGDSDAADIKWLKSMV
jgi:predicted TIM-barrel fold metal-dependent hydrolase